MSTEKTLQSRSGSTCELCTSDNELSIYKVGPDSKGNENDSILVCSTCSNQIENPDDMDANHWRCLNDSMWSEVPAVQIVAYRMLSRLKQEGWPQDLLDMMYLDEDNLEWAKATGEGEEEDEDAIKHIDSNGVQLQNGDSVVLVKDLPVKGGNFTAKRGTAVRRISLVWDNAEHIEGRVEGQQVVILTQYVKKL